MADLPPARLSPCHECPWRRVSAPGWLGPFIEIIVYNPRKAS